MRNSFVIYEKRFRKRKKKTEKHFEKQNSNEKYNNLKLK